MYRFYSNPPDINRISVVGEYQDGVLRLAASKCSKKDSFMRKKGRTIAEGRFNKGKFCKEIPLNNFTIKDFIINAQLVIKEIHNDSSKLYI